MFNWLYKAEKPNGHLRQPGRISELGVPTGGSDAIKWFRKAAEKGSIWGQFNLGIRYAHGDGVTQDIAEARKWFEKAADQNDAMSQFCLGEIFDRVAVDQAEAYKWYCLAASHGIRAADNARRRLQTNLTPEQIAAGQTHPMPPAPKKKT